MIISTEGNIGAGKTTFLQQLEKDERFKVIYEPVEDWLNMKCSDTGMSIFEHFYADKTKYSFVFQMLALQTRFENILKASREHSDKIIVLERSIYTDYEIFAKLGRKEGFMNDIEMQVYEKFHDFMCAVGKDICFGNIIYLKASPETCFERIKKRNRSGEDVITIEYLKDLHDAHERWLNGRDNIILVDAERQLNVEDIAMRITQSNHSI